MTFMTSITTVSMPVMGWQEIAGAMKNGVYVEPLDPWYSPVGELTKRANALLDDTQDQRAITVLNEKLERYDLVQTASGGISQEPDASEISGFVQKLNPEMNRRMEGLAQQLNAHTIGLPLFPRRLRLSGAPSDGLDDHLIAPSLTGAMLKHSADRNLFSLEAVATFAYAVGGNISMNLRALGDLRTVVGQQVRFRDMAIGGTAGTLFLRAGARLLGGVLWGHALLNAVRVVGHHAQREQSMSAFKQPTGRKEALAAIDHSAGMHLDLLRGYADAFPGAVSTDPAVRMIESGLLASNLRLHLEPKKKAPIAVEMEGA